MSSYTMQLRAYIEQATQYEKGLSIRDKIERGRTKLFDFDYPLFDPTYKGTFETNFIRYFYSREIGFETEELFKFNLETWLLINMPYFNKRFESELLVFDPLINYKVTETDDVTKNKTQNDNRTIDNTSSTDGTTGQDTTLNSTVNGSTTRDTTGSVTDDNFNREIKASTPDSRLNLTTNDGQGVLEYADNVEEENTNNKRDIINADDTTHTQTTVDTGTNDVITSTDSTGHQTDVLTSTITNLEDYIRNKSGKIGDKTYSQMVNEYRQTFIRVEREIFDEMQQLFMLVY